MMLSTTKEQAAKALFPLLSVFHEVDGVPLEAVTASETDGTIIELRLKLGPKFLVIRAEAEDDTVDLLIETETAGDLVSDRKPWIEMIGQEIGWGWVMVNQQGYLDGVLLSFGGVVPQVLITAVASGLKVSKVTSL